MRYNQDYITAFLFVHPCDTSFDYIVTGLLFPPIYRYGVSVVGFTGNQFRSFFIYDLVVVQFT